MVISPKTKIGELLQAYPQLESVLIEMSPVFEKLKNPVLRKTVARVATIQQIAAVGGIPVDDIIRRLRKETGQDENVEETRDLTEYSSSVEPEWFDTGKISVRFDASPIINAGESPLNEVLHKAMQLGKDEILELQTPFLPAPVLDLLKSKNFRIYTLQKGLATLSYIRK